MMEYDEDNIGDESVFENKRCVKFVSSPQFMSPKRKFNSSIIDLNLTDNGTPKAVIRDKFKRVSIALTSREVELDRERQARFDLEREHQELQEFTRLESEAGVDEERRMSVARSGSESDLLDRMKWLEKSYKDGENMNLQLGKSLSESKQECNHLKLVVEDLRKNLTDVTETEEKGSIRLIELEPLVEEVKQLREKTCADESPSNATFANTTLGVPLEVVEEMKNQLLFLQQQLINFSPEELQRKVLEIEELKAENSKLMLKLPTSEKPDEQVTTADLDKVLEEKAEELKSKHKAELAIVTTKTREEMNFNLATLEEKLRDEFEEKKLEATKD